ncbi:phenylalanine--tRNA ligase subunit beta [Patescibacteria group bacterium]|nr:phenylalanine--tRNA ligase subunit beta [Patescibacteria group bacterium]MBU2460228.1 phenylalanine--tRNA ligase subunit beta [Patescibacteria group bacterium]MBU2544567.1 phenylalanine--tRNA ligase subunit beta [Patescibacteria group bacterium]
MNILVPDNWLREYLKTKATPDEIKEYLSLCGPSVERINKVSDEIVYDIEVTGNRPDSMSVAGIAREAAVILPRFGIKASLVGDPYQEQTVFPKIVRPRLKLKIITDPALNPRWTSVVFDNVKIGASPEWLKKQLDLIGVRSLNNVIDITNYLMHAYGQPAHVFDYNQIGKASMTLRLSKKGEVLTTLDGKRRILPGGDIVIEDGTGKLIDLCGIMGGENSSVKSATTNVVLFLQTYDPARIRKTAMTIALHTEAATLFEKGTDTELVLPVFIQAISLIRQLAQANIAGDVLDLYPRPYKPPRISVRKEKLSSYIGARVDDTQIKDILSDLGFKPQCTNDAVSVRVPSYRRDVTIDVDIIEEIARIYGYRHIHGKLPEGEPPVVIPDMKLAWEEEIKIRLRDWGYTELYTYSMISEDLMDAFGLNKAKAYKIANPLSQDWVYMRPHLFPSIFEAVRQNLKLTNELRVFELSMAYQYRSDDLPLEIPTLIVVWTGDKFLEAKGLGEAIFALFGIPLPQEPEDGGNQPFDIYGSKCLRLGSFGSLGELCPAFLAKAGVQSPLTQLYLDFVKLVEKANPVKTYTPISKYPESYEDLAFIVPPGTHIWPMIQVLSKVDPLIKHISLMDSFNQTRTLHIIYHDPRKNLTDDDIRPVREKLLKVAAEKFQSVLKSV